jgi:hypothetical protein
VRSTPISTWLVALAVLVLVLAGVVLEPEPEGLLELQAAMSVAAATAATAAVVAREGPTPKRLRNLMGTSWEALSRLRYASVRAAGLGPGVAVCQENRSDVSMVSMGLSPTLVADTKQRRRYHPIFKLFRGRTG